MYLDGKIKDIKRGEMYYITDSTTESYTFKMGRPAVIVSSDMGLEKNKTTVMVAFCTTNLEKVAPHFVKITTAPRTSLVRCNEIYTINRRYIGDYMCTLNEYEMRKMDEQLAFCLGLASPTDYECEDDGVDSEYEDDIVEEEEIEYEDENVALRVENSLYKKLYEKAMEQLVELKFSKECVPPEPIKEVAPVPKEPVEVEAPVVKANVNTDTVQEIVQKTGINIHTAREIVRYRRELGRYEKLEDLLICPRIGKASLEKWRDKFEV